MVAVHVAHDVEGVGVFQAIQQFAAFLPSIGVENHGIDLPDVGIDSVAEKQHLQQWNDQRKKQSSEIAAHVQCLFVKNGSESTEHFTHGESPFLSRRSPD